LAAIREAVRDKIDLHVDFNLSLGKGSKVGRLIQDLHENFDLSIVEDPFRRPNYFYRKLRHQIEPKLMMDSGTFWPRIRSVSKSGAVDIVNRHTDQQGGLDLALLISQTASSSGIEDAIGSSGLVGIGESAFQILAGTIGLTRPCESILFSNYAAPEFEGFYGTQNVSVIAVADGDKNGVINLNGEPGIGVVIDRSLLQAHTARVCVLTKGSDGHVKITYE
jgi:L-alanine-DL-glutamate epimerase-like enolase superfamily enzyme